MINESKLKIHYLNIAKKLDEIVPVDWDEIVMYGEELGDVRTVCIYYKPKGVGQYKSGGSIPNDYSFNEDKYVDLIYSLMHINRELHKEFVEAGKPSWKTITFKLGQDNHFKIHFDYAINRDTSNFEREIYWAYNELDIIPDDEFSKKILEEYLAANNKQ